MIKKFCASCVIAMLPAVCLTSIASAQATWWRTYGGAGDEGGVSVQQTSDSGYIVVGYTSSYGSGVNDVYLIKTNAQGDTLWTRTYGGTVSDNGRSVQQTSDGGYIVAGSTSSYGDSSQFYLIKTNAAGDTLWTRTYGGPRQDYCQSVQRTSDSGYIVAGYTNSSYPQTGWDIRLIKTNAQGDTLWTRTYGGTNDEVGGLAQQTSDSGYIVVGETYSSGNGYDIYLVKTNAQGDTLWTRTYGGTSSDWGWFVQQTTDGGYIVSGYTYSYGNGGDDVWLIKTNAQGDTLWTRTYGGAQMESGYCVQQTSDNGYIVAGTTTSYGSGGYDFWLIKANAQGDTLWTRTYGGTSDEVCYFVRQTSDGGYILTGTTNSYGNGGHDVYLIKTDSLGNVAGIEEPSTQHPASPTRLLVQPNPFTSFARVPGHGIELFTLSDIAGRQVAVCKGDRIGAGLRPGVYFLSPVGHKTGKAVTTTIIKAAH